MGLLGCKVDVCLTSVDTAKQISKELVPVYMTICSIRELQLFHVFANSLILVLVFILAFLVGIQKYLVVTVIHISLVNNDVENLFFCFWSLGCPLLWSACS